ncbi:MAG: protein phosphatase 2C domain-containing protein [Burkholderiales bacterium]
MDKESNQFTIQSKELSQLEQLLNKEMAGAQVVLLTGSTSLWHMNEGLLRNVATGRLADPQRTKINSASLYERNDYWEKRGTRPDKRLHEWQTNMDTYLKKQLQDEEKRNLLERILKRHNQTPDEVVVNAETIYNRLMVDQKGDVEFFARRLSREDIKQHAEVIQEFAGIYGQNSSKIAKILAEGIINANDQPCALIDSAQRELSDEERIILETLDLHAQAKEKKYLGQIAKAQTRYQEQPALREVAQQTKSEPHKAREELRQLVEEDVGVCTETDKGQDAYFADTENAIFGVFDGVGSYRHSGEAANIASEHINVALAGIESNLDLDKTKHTVRDALIQVSEEINEEVVTRYKIVEEDIRKNIAGNLSDDDFDNKYKPRTEYDNSSISKWIKGELDAAEPTERLYNGLTSYIHGWIKKQVTMATTASVVKLWQGENGDKQAIIANAGDSRVYVYKNKEDKLEIITIDDNFLYEVVDGHKAREIQKALGNGAKIKDVLAEETVVLKESNPLHKKLWTFHHGTIWNEKDYRFWQNGEVEVPLKNISSFAMTRQIPFVGTEPTIKQIKIASGDRIVMTTDGVHDNLRTSEIEEIIRNNPDPIEAANAAKRKLDDIRELARTLKGRSYKADDITFVVIAIN